MQCFLHCIYESKKKSNLLPSSLFSQNPRLDFVGCDRTATDVLGLIPAQGHPSATHILSPNVLDFAGHIPDEPARQLALLLIVRDRREFLGAPGGEASRSTAVLHLIAVRGREGGVVVEKKLH